MMSVCARCVVFRAATGYRGGDEFRRQIDPEFDGAADVVEWFTQAELLCQPRGVVPEAYLPLRLAGDAFVV